MVSSGSRLEGCCADDSADLGELLHEVHLGVQAAGRIDENDIGLASNRRVDAVEDDRAGVGPRLMLDDLDSAAVGPDLELFDRGGAESIRRGEHRLSASRRRTRCELGGGRRLSRPVDAHHEDDPRLARRRGPDRGPRHREAPLDLGRRPAARRRSPRRPCFPASSRTAATSSAAVAGPTSAGCDERLLQSLERMRVGREARTDGVPHLRDQLGVGHQQPALEAGEDRSLLRGLGHRRRSDLLRERPARLLEAGADRRDEAIGLEEHEDEVAVLHLGRDDAPASGSRATAPRARPARHAARHAPSRRARPTGTPRGPPSRRAVPARAIVCPCGSRNAAPTQAGRLEEPTRTSSKLRLLLPAAASLARKRRALLPSSLSGAAATTRSM